MGPFLWLFAEFFYDIRDKHGPRLLWPVYSALGVVFFVLGAIEILAAWLVLPKSLWKRYYLE